MWRNMPIFVQFFAAPSQKVTICHLIISRYTGLKYTEFLHDESLPCHLLKPLNDQPIHCRTPKQRVKAVNFDVGKNIQKLIGYHSNVRWATAK